jgi:hypothetical protein
MEEDDVQGMESLTIQQYKIEKDIYSISFISLIDGDKLAVCDN